MKFFWKLASSDLVLIGFSVTICEVFFDEKNKKLKNDEFGILIAKRFDKLFNSKKMIVNEMQEKRVLYAIQRVTLERENSKLTNILEKMKPAFILTGNVTESSSFRELLDWFESRGIVF